MNNWLERWQVGERHEIRVVAELEQRGWTVQRTGQGTWHPQIRAALRVTDSAMRFFPDMLASRGDEVIAIDAKDRMPSTSSSKYTVSRATLRPAIADGALACAAPLRLRRPRSPHAH